MSKSSDLELEESTNIRDRDAQSFGSIGEVPFLERDPPSSTDPVGQSDQEHDNRRRLASYPLLCSTRFAICFLAFAGYFMEYAMRVNISSALESMYEGEFDWSRSEQGYVLSAFFYGYILTQIIGGLTSERVGPKIVMEVSIFVSGFCTLLCPIAAKLGLWYLVVLRFVIGFSEGAFIPAISQLWSRWAPPLERSVLSAFAFSGTVLGSITSLAGSGFVCSTLGWEYMFYIFGIGAILWSIIWHFYGASCPSKSRTISHDERRYIQSSLRGQGTETHQVESFFDKPWKAILTSRACWAIWVAHTAANVGNYLILTELPTYMSDVLKFNIKSNGVMSAIPYVSLGIAVNLAGLVADWLRRHHMLSTGNTRKLMNTLALSGWVTFFLFASRLDSNDRIAAVALIAVGQGLLGCHVSGCFVNVVDIAPRYAGLVFGISNTIATLPGIILPTLVSAFVHQGTRAEWQYVFVIGSVFVIVCNVLNLMFGKGNVQDWAL